MRSDLRKLIAGWRLVDGPAADQQVEGLLEPAYAAGWLPDNHRSFNAPLMADQYHLGGAEDTRRMAELLGITAADRVVDLACYIGGPARQLAREYGCRVVGVDISEVHVEVARALTRLCRLEHKVSFICASADAVPERNGSFTVAWSQCSFPADLSWMREIHRLLAPAGRVGFTGQIRRSAGPDPHLFSLDAVREHTEGFGFRVLSAEDISEMDLEFGWLAIRRKLQQNECHYRRLMGDEWVEQAYSEQEREITAWQEERMGNGRVVAVKA